jgi:integrase/recombinase XerD
VLLVRESKFNKSRYVPLHTTVLDALERYARRRDELCPHPRDASFFVSLRRARLDAGAAQATFRRLCQNVGVGADAPFPPMLHDLRHTKAVNTLLGWHSDGVDVQSRLPALATPIWGIATPPTPTTTSQPRRSFWPVPPACSTPLRRRSHDLIAPTP